MLSFNIVTSEYAHVVSAVVATWALVKAWFYKEIKAGKLLLAHAEVVITNDAKKIEEHAVQIEKLVLSEIKKL